MTVIGYSKLGRSWRLSPNDGTVTGGDVDVRRALDRLAARHPDWQFVLIGRNSAEAEVADFPLPANVSNPWVELQPLFSERVKPLSRGDMRKEPDRNGVIAMLDELTRDLFLACDAHVVWAGQHGTHNSTIPLITGDGDSITQDNMLYYSSYVIRGINAWRDESNGQREEVWLVPDPRNLLKCRDLKWPLREPVIAQFNSNRTFKNYRYGDTQSPSAYGFNAKTDDKHNLWMAPTHYVYDALELTALPHPTLVPFADNHDQRYDFGILMNENRANVTRNRLDIAKSWVFSNWPDAELFGKWTPKSQEALGRVVKQCPRQYLYSTLQRWRCTLTTPASGSGWATAKPWESFAAGTICFFHPDYDTQNHILHDAPSELRDWLRVPTADALRQRVDTLASDENAWRWLAMAQRAHFEQRFTDTYGGVKAIEERLCAHL